MFLKRTIILSILLSLLLKYMENGFIMLQFHINQNYIAQVLCENKDRPAMKCFGKCQLSKKLIEAEKKEEQNKSLFEKFSVAVPAILNISDPIVLTAMSLDYPFSPDYHLRRVYLSPPVIPPDTSATPKAIYS